METKEIYASYDDMKIMGRNFIDENNALCMVHSGAYVEFDYICNKLYIDISAYLDKKSRVAVFVNGNLVYDLMIKVSEENRIIEIVDSEKLHYGTVKIVKLNEPLLSSVVKINKVIIDEKGRIYPSKKGNVNIEFIGDSITCGYGVEAVLPTEPFENETENVLKAYSYMASQEVKADFQIVSYSGFGIISGYGADGEKLETETLPQYYEETALLPDGKLAGKWDFKKFVPDIIVVNLGTNDFNYCNDGDKIHEFYLAYTEFLKKLRKLNPNAEFLCTIGIMGDKLSDVIQEAVWNYSYDFNDSKVHFANFPAMKKEDGYGANYHPSEITQKKSAREMVRVLRKYYDEMYKLS